MHTPRTISRDNGLLQWVRHGLWKAMPKSKFLEAQRTHPDRSLGPSCGIKQFAHSSFLVSVGCVRTRSLLQTYLFETCCIAISCAPTRHLEEYEKTSRHAGALHCTSKQKKVRGAPSDGSPSNIRHTLCECWPTFCMLSENIELFWGGCTRQTPDE